MNLRRITDLQNERCFVIIVTNSDLLSLLACTGINCYQQYIIRINNNYRNHFTSEILKLCRRCSVLFQSYKYR